MSIGSATASQALLTWLTGGAQTPPTQLYVALGSGIASNGALTELTGTDYARQPVSLVDAAGVASNTAAVTFGPSAAGWSVAAVALFDALTGGNCWFVGPAAAVTTVAAGQQAQFPVGALTFTFLTVPSVTVPPVSIIAPLPSAPAAIAASQVTTGGTAVTAITGPVDGAYIVNPLAAADQGIGTAETLYVDPVNAPGSTAGAGSGTAVALAPGQSWSLPTAIPAGAVVRVNAATSGHKFTGVQW